MIKVVIIDDHVVVRAGLRYIIEADPKLALLGENMPAAHGIVR